MKLQSISIKARKGFSIVEVAVALGVVTLMLTTFLGIFGPAQKNVQVALSSKDANSMKDELSNEMSVLRTSQTYDNSFDKTVKYILESHDPTTAVVVYRYKALPQSAANNTSGLLPAFGQNNEPPGIPGRDFIVQTAVRKLDQQTENDIMAQELSGRSIDGPVFVVRMTQLITDPDDDTNLILSTSTGTLLDPNDGTPVPGNDPAQYDDGVISFRAEFFKLPSNRFEFVDSSGWVFDDLGSPVIEANIAVRR